MNVCLSVEKLLCEALKSNSHSKENVIMNCTCCCSQCLCVVLCAVPAGELHLSTALIL